ncbi:MAG: DUF1254 domain-containing protein [Phyllobacterium sp.]|uniref:DUF1254 domain-containing protein n=1 Tax=Phyllobacterium sp. TaxID=1871046 RepID=UPI0030F22265
MRQYRALAAVVVLAGTVCLNLPAHAQEQNPYGWLGTETLKTRSGEFEFKGGYPVGDAAERLLDLRKLNQAIEVYLTQLMPVSEIGLREGLRAFGAKKPAQVVIWENLMDAKTVLLTANTETVYALSHLDLKTDGPTVVEAPPKMLGFLQDGLATSRMSARLATTRARAASFLCCRPVSKARFRRGIFVKRSPTYSVTLGLRGFQVKARPIRLLG